MKVSQKLKRNQIIANGVMLIFLAVGLVVVWFNAPLAFWSAVISIPFSVLIAVYIEKRMKKYQDERFSHILTRSAYNGFLFLLFALPITAVLIALSLLDALAAILVLSFSAIAVMYGSGAYYFRK